ncbi:hypothetical protein PLESTM_001934200 [Pleodorina starrii]|nr:hypothetical protein PLESTM_001934200 [Pleodorina starrii]
MHGASGVSFCDATFFFFWTSFVTLVHVDLCTCLTAVWCRAALTCDGKPAMRHCTAHRALVGSCGELFFFVLEMEGGEGLRPPMTWLWAGGFKCELMPGGIA